MRGTVPGLPTPHPLIAMLPAVYQEDPLAGRFTAAFDDVLAPVLASLDCLPAYLDPRVAPTDFLDLLASWVGVALDENWPVERRREAVLVAVELHGLRGTARGLQWQLDLVTGGRAEVVDGGGVTWSDRPDGNPVPEEAARLVVRVAAGATAAELTEVRDLVAWAKPAHVEHSIEVAGERAG